MPGVWHSIAGHRAQTASNVIVARTPQPCSAGAARSGRRGALGRVLKATTARPWGGSGTANQATYQPWPASPRMNACRNHEKAACRTASRLLASGRAKTTSVIDAINRRARPEAGLPVLILTIPNNPILQSCAPPDYNCGATLVHTGMCIHIFFLIDFAFLRGR
jgi:hypothetical protein